MALKHKEPATAAQANIDDASAAAAAAANNDYSDASSSFSDGEIIYTPPDSDDNMASSSRSKVPGSARAAPLDGMVTATLGPKVPQDAGAANISMREYIYFLPYPLPLNTEIPYSIYLPGKNPLGLPSCQFDVSTREAFQGGV
jgi:hypothetical protein